MKRRDRIIYWIASEKMLEKAKLRIHSDNVQFIQTE
jgi:hypothetical protein